MVLYAQRVTDLIQDGVFRRPGLGETTDPTTGNFIIGYTGFNNESFNVLGLGAELSGKWQPTDGVDISANYSFERLANCAGGCTFNVPVSDPAAAATNNTAQHKLNVSASWRTKVGLDLAMDLHAVSGVSWVEKQFNPAASTGVDLNPFAIPSYTLINARVGYRLLRDRLDLGVSVYNLLGDEHREHPFGNQIGRRVMFTASGAF